MLFVNMYICFACIETCLRDMLLAAKVGIMFQ